MIDREELKYKIAFSALKGITLPLGRLIIDRLCDEKSFFDTKASSLSNMFGIRSKLFDDSQRQEALALAESETDFVRATPNVRPIYFTSPDYPKRLAECPDAPLMLYAIGDCDLNNSRMIGIVGTRNATPYGASFINKLIDELSSKVQNIVIVSGLAYGIDVIAHKTALRAKVPTVAVVAHGLTTIYPAVHRNVAVDMTRHGGMILTEYRSDAAVHKGNFLARNRIVAGLCDCLIVVESADKGGALVTARLASDYDREVFALPGRFNDTYSAGCNKLIRDNVAQILTSADDLIEFMRWPTMAAPDQQSALPLDFSTDELEIINFLKENGDTSINKLATSLNRPVSKLMATLIDLDLKGVVITLPGSHYRLS